MKKIFKILFSRFAIVSILIIVQFIFLAFLLYYIEEKFIYVSLVVDFITLIAVIIIINRVQAPSTKVPWIIVVALLPMGWLIYLIFGLYMISRGKKKKFHTLGQFSLTY
jgi:cardiolipin synthase